MKTSAIIIALAAAFASANVLFGSQLENQAVVRRADGDAGMANMPGMNSEASAKPTRAHDAAWSATHVAKSHDAAWSATKAQGGAAVASATSAGSVAAIAATASAVSVTSKASAAGAASTPVTYSATSKAPTPATYTGAAAPHDISGSMFGFVAAVVAAAAI